MNLSLTRNSWRASITSHWTDVLNVHPELLVIYCSNKCYYMKGFRRMYPKFSGCMLRYFTLHSSVRSVVAVWYRCALCPLVRTGLLDAIRWRDTSLYQTHSKFTSPSSLAPLSPHILYLSSSSIHIRLSGNVMFLILTAVRLTLGCDSHTILRESMQRTKMAMQFARKAPSFCRK